MKKWQRNTIIIVVALVGLALAKDLLIQGVITTVGSSVVGAPVKIGRFSLGILTQKVSIRNFKLLQPAGFPQDEPLIDIPQITVQTNVFSVLKGKLHLKLLVVDVKQMTLITNKEGKLNVDSLKVAQQPQKKDEKKPAPEMALQIDLMKLNIGQVIVKDYTKGEPPSVQAFPVGLTNKEFRDIKSAQQLATVVLMEGLGPTALKSAGIYAAATILGIGFLPAGVAGVLIAKDSASAELSTAMDKAHSAIVKLVSGIGRVASENAAKGMIKAKVNGANVTIKLEKKENNKTLIVISARQMMIPKPEIAGGVLHQILEKVK